MFTYCKLNIFGGVCCRCISAELYIGVATSFRSLDQVEVLCSIFRWWSSGSAPVILSIKIIATFCNEQKENFLFVQMLRMPSLSKVDVSTLAPVGIQSLRQMMMIFL